MECDDSDIALPLISVFKMACCATFFPKILSLDAPHNSRVETKLREVSELTQGHQISLVWELILDL